MLILKNETSLRGWFIGPQAATAALVASLGAFLFGLDIGILDAKKSRGLKTGHLWRIFKKMTTCQDLKKLTFLQSENKWLVPPAKQKQKGVGIHWWPC